MSPPAATRTVTLTVRATNGAEWNTDRFNRNQKIHLVGRKAIEYFVAQRLMADGDYAIALLEHGEARVLSDADSLEDAGVGDNAVLVLVPRDPQVDG